MLLASLLLSVVSFTPGFAQHPAAHNYVEGFVQTPASETTCHPNHICATLQTTKLHGCFVVNFANSGNGGTPLAIDVTQSGAAGTTTTIYWINNYNKDVQIAGQATAKYYCPYY